MIVESNRLNTVALSHSVGYLHIWVETEPHSKCSGVLMAIIARGLAEYLWTPARIRGETKSTWGLGHACTRISVYLTFRLKTWHQRWWNCRAKNFCKEFCDWIMKGWSSSRLSIFMSLWTRPGPSPEFIVDPGPSRTGNILTLSTPS